MTIELRRDSDGNDFQVWSQQQAMSCSVASLWMAETMAQQASTSEGEWEMAWDAYQAAIVGVCSNEPAPAAMTSSPNVPGPGMGQVFEIDGLDTAQLMTVIKRRGMNVTRVTTTGNPVQIDTTKIGTGKPAICLVGWYARTPAGAFARDASGSVIRMGGHFVVAARRASSGRIVILDPMGGVLREVANTGFYQGNGIIQNVLYISA